MTKRLLFILTAAMLALMLCGCNQVGESEETHVSTLPAASETTGPSENSSEPPVFSCKLYTKGPNVFFVNPVNGFLTAANLSSSETSILYEGRVWDEFFVYGDRIFFRELSENKICSVLKTGDGLREYLKMPFTTGIMAKGVIYFIDSTVYGSDTVLYRYSVFEGTWATSVLSGNRSSPVRNTLVFTDDRVYYTSASGGYVGIMEYIYKTGEKKVVWPSSVNSALAIPEILKINGSLIFKNPENDGFIGITPDGDASYINVEGTRVYGELGGEILFSSFENHGVLKRGNADGQVSECEGGVVLACGQSKALILRSDRGEDKIALVKYPEDEEQLKLTGSVYKTLICDGYALVFMRDKSSAVLISFEQAAKTDINVGVVSISEVKIEQYLAETVYSQTMPSADELKASSPAVIAQVFAEAVSKNDRATLNMLLPAAVRLAPYDPIYLKSWRVSLAGSEGTVYNIEYTPYSEGDLAFRDNWPDTIKKGTLSFNERDGVWTISAG